MRTNEELVREFISAYNRFDIDSMLAVLHPAVSFRNISDGEITVQTSGRDEFEKLARESAKLFSSREQKIRDISETEQYIKVKIDYTAILAVDMAGMKCGETLNISGGSEYTFKDELIYTITDLS